MRLSPLLLPLAALPASTFAADYLSLEQAQKLMFADADHFSVRDALLEPALVARVQGRASTALASGHLRYRLASRNGVVLGAVVVDEVIGKYEHITYALALDAAGTVKQIEILSYRESHGQEVRLPAWRKQFAGKTALAPLRLGEDIANISGATLSCAHLTDGVRRLVTVFEALRRAGALA